MGGSLRRATFPDVYVYDLGHASQFVIAGEARGDVSLMCLCPDLCCEDSARHVVQPRTLLEELSGLGREV